MASIFVFHRSIVLNDFRGKKSLNWKGRFCSKFIWKNCLEQNYGSWNGIGACNIILWMNSGVCPVHQDAFAVCQCVSLWMDIHNRVLRYFIMRCICAYLLFNHCHIQVTEYTLYYGASNNKILLQTPYNLSHIHLTKNCISTYWRSTTPVTHWINTYYVEQVYEWRYVINVMVVVNETISNVQTIALRTPIQTALWSTINLYVTALCYKCAFSFAGWFKLLHSRQMNWWKMKWSNEKM